MTTMTMNKSTRAHRFNPEHTEKALIQTRLENVGKKFVDALTSVEGEKLLSLLTLSDGEFWSELKILALTQSVINNTDVEKNEQEEYAEARLAFLNSLEKYGGVHKSTTVKGLLGLSVPTIHKYGKHNKLIVLEWGAEKLYPVFQFSIDERFSDNGMLKGLQELLARITHNVSSVRKCNFFTRKIEIPGCAEKTTVLDILRRGATEQEMAHLRILADNFGTNNSV
ncbi:hypothetical protein D9980_18965 [Serratia sp. 3ACOL1]|uniref:hypothetical protein n=1 Tax=Serratia sp. 3ACOL1 TaxID=2448483 RepID=UPI000EF4A3E9|nr:hypothetical protein [Serratia sp. 3ACOL1]AYM92482.1 hypothetical protein D9980_18965 [Serratia sp. 3ACOL1]